MSRSPSIFSWPIALLMGFFTAVATLVVETIFTVSGQMLGLVSTGRVAETIGSSVALLAILAILEEGSKYVTVHSFPFLRSRPNAFLAGIGFALLEPLLFWYIHPVGLPETLPPFASNALLHATTFVLYSFSLPRRRTSVMFLFFGIAAHGAFNLFLARDLSSLHILTELILGLILSVLIFLPREDTGHQPGPEAA